MNTEGVTPSPAAQIATRYHQHALEEALNLENTAVRAGDTQTATLAAQAALPQISGAGLAPDYANRIGSDVRNPNPSMLYADETFIKAKSMPNSVMSPETPIISLDGPPPGAAPPGAMPPPGGPPGGPPPGGPPPGAVLLNGPPGGPPPGGPPPGAIQVSPRGIYGGG